MVLHGCDWGCVECGGKGDWGLRAEVERYAGYDKELAAVGLRNGEMVAAFESQLAAMTAARDEACEIAESLRVAVDRSDAWEYVHGPQDQNRKVRIAALRKVGR